jgi:hypothetical protein
VVSKLFNFRKHPGDDEVLNALGEHFDLNQASTVRFALRFLHHSLGFNVKDLVEALIALKNLDEAIDSEFQNLEEARAEAKRVLKKNRSKLARGRMPRKIMADLLLQEKAARKTMGQRRRVP